jgi:hypothetical protein
MLFACRFATLAYLFITTTFALPYGKRSVRIGGRLINSPI